MKRSPTAALWLSICPGVGHVYLGHSMKGLVLIVAVVSTFILAERSGDGLVPVALFFWVSGAIDAYRTAQEMNHLAATGYELPRSATQFAVSKWWGWGLIAIGVVFFLENFGVFDLDWVVDFWPIGLIGLGVYILRRPVEPEQPSHVPPLPPQQTAAPEQDEQPEQDENDDEADTSFASSDDAQDSDTAGSVGAEERLQTD